MEPRRYLIALAITLYSAVCSAEIYKWVDANGKTQYSDTPPEQASYSEVAEKDLPYVHGQKPVNVRPYRPVKPEQGQHLIVERSKASLNECKRAKRQAIYAEKRRDRLLAEKHDSWIWKNCKGYTDELRRLSKEMD